MRITSLYLNDIRSYQNNTIDFSKKVNIFSGPNNSGKTTILKCIYLLQGSTLNYSDILKGRKISNIEITLEDLHFTLEQKKLFTNTIVVTITDNEINKHYKPIHPNHVSRYNDKSNIEPNNLIYPHFSNRKVVKYDETINISTANQVIGNFSNLYSKIDRLISSDTPAADQFKEACKEILGLPISTYASENGKKAGLAINTFSHISLESMGEGTINMLGMIVDLCVAEGKIFLIEEPENDIHPKALKKLLQLIEKKSAINQFFISTHSNIVVKYLGAAKDTKLFSIDMQLNDRLPITTVNEVKSSDDRKQLIENLGYEFYDYDLWKAWLFLEESSAERIIREVLIPNFVPSLTNQLKTFSAGGSGNIKGKFNDFNRLFVFLHLEPKYKNRAWVIIDSGPNENEIISSLKATYINSGWDEKQFLQFSKHDFEEFYPERFEDKVKKIQDIENKQVKRQAKLSLLEQVIEWVENDKAAAIQEFKISAKAVIEILKEIERKIK